jgi:DNA-binding MarR family transcriptional regulator
MQKRNLVRVAEETEHKREAMPQADILWLRDFLFYRVPVAASYMLRETSLVCREQKPKLTTAQWRIISILANYPSLLATEISRISMLDQVAVSRALASLAHRGFVQRQRNRQDKRAREVSLTASGWRYYGSIMPIMKAQNDIIRGMFSQAELTTLYKALDRIDSVFEVLSEQRRLYGDDVELLDVVERKLPAIPFRAQARTQRRAKI